MPFPAELLQHSITAYAALSTPDTSGGEVLTYSPTARYTQAAALVSTSSASTVELYEKQNLVVSHTIATQQTGTKISDKILAYDSDGTLIGNFAVRGVRYQPGVPDFVDIGTFTMIDCEQVVN